MVKPWLLVPTKWAHDMSPFFLNIIAKVCKAKPKTWKPKTWKGLEFSNPVGIAGGVDKNGQCLQAWDVLGAGFVEIGTVTPLPQKPNPGVIMKRFTKKKALWNKMGFPNSGMKVAYNKLNQVRKNVSCPVFVNIGKNRQTTLEDAHKDYIKVMDTTESVADAFVINISSPNTSQLRDLFLPEQFANFLKPIVNHNQTQISIQKPLLLKLSPDLNTDQVKTIIDTSLNLGIDGWILTNTTTARDNIQEAPKAGGISGAPLASASRNLLNLCTEHLRGRKKDQILISCGGVLTPQDVYDRLSLGADFVQVYSALIFDGPFFFRKVVREALSR